MSKVVDVYRRWRWRKCGVGVVTSRKHSGGVSCGSFAPHVNYPSRVVVHVMPLPYALPFAWCWSGGPVAWLQPGRWPHGARPVESAVCCAACGRVQRCDVVRCGAVWCSCVQMACSKTNERRAISIQPHLQCDTNASVPRSLNATIHGTTLDDCAANACT